MNWILVKLKRELRCQCEANASEDVYLGISTKNAVQVVLLDQREESE